jgi:N utilization substance protein A
MKGIRIHSIVRELANENIDVINYSEDAGLYIARALAPAKLKDIYLDKAAKVAKIVADEDQISLIIGKNGQNIKLASRLTGYEIDVERKGGKKNAAADADADDEDDTDDDSDENMTDESTAEVNTAETPAVKEAEEIKAEEKDADENENETDEETEETKDEVSGNKVTKSKVTKSKQTKSKETKNEEVSEE